jgi:hypothetical protein
VIAEVDCGDFKDCGNVTITHLCCPSPDKLKEIRQKIGYSQKYAEGVPAKEQPWCSPRSKEEKGKKGCNLETNTPGDYNSPGCCSHTTICR